MLNHMPAMLSIGCPGSWDAAGVCAAHQQRRVHKTARLARHRKNLASDVSSAFTAGETVLEDSTASAKSIP